MRQTKAPTQLKLAYLIDQTLAESKLDPARVDLGKHANLVRALYSRLVEFDLDGSLRPSLASSFDVNENVVTFNIPTVVKTQDGDFIGAKDVAYSLIRLLVIKSNRHSSLGHFLCGKEIRSISDSCEGIRWSEDEVKLVLRDTKYVKFILPILASVDFSVVPYKSINWNKPELPIENYRNTSGVFYLERDYEVDSGTALLKKNYTHPYASDEVADSILLVRTNFDQMKEYFISSKVDVIPGIFPFTDDIVNEVVQKDGFVHESLPIKIWFLNNLENAYSEFSKEELRYISAIVKENAILEGLNYKCTQSNFLFPHNSAGGLTEQQVESVQLLWRTVKPVNIKKKFKLWVPIAKVDLFKKSLENYPFIEVYSDNILPLLKPKTEQPHSMIVAMDSTFFEDLSMLSYNFNIGTFGYSKTEAEKWINNYIQIDDKIKRVQQLQDLHYLLLQNLKIVPLGFSPYVAVAKNGWTINFSKYYAGSPLWRIKRQ